jgi:hypothetical protein
MLDHLLPPNAPISDFVESGHRSAMESMGPALRDHAQYMQPSAIPTDPNLSRDPYERMAEAESLYDTQRIELGLEILSSGTGPQTHTDLSALNRARDTLGLQRPEPFPEIKPPIYNEERFGPESYDPGYRGLHGIGRPSLPEKPTLPIEAIQRPPVQTDLLSQMSNYEPPELPDPMEAVRGVVDDFTKKNRDLFPEPEPFLDYKPPEPVPNYEPRRLEKPILDSVEIAPIVRRVGPETVFKGYGHSHFSHVGDEARDEWGRGYHVSTQIPGIGNEEGFDSGLSIHDHTRDM